jgi:putative endonuclease
MKVSRLPHRQQLGKSGEYKAASYLQKSGYRIIATNFKARYGEIDIIAVYKNVLVFFEVKARTGNRYGTPEESVTPRKLREVIQTAEFFKQLHPELPDAMRIDVIGLDIDDNGSVTDLRHTQNVTGDL